MQGDGREQEGPASGPDPGWRPWGAAIQEALYGPAGFYRRHVPAAHFQTSVGFPEYAQAVRRLADEVDASLGRPDPYDVVDVGAGQGELLLGLGDVPGRWRLTAVEVRDDPGGPLRWTSRVPPVTGLLVANEWLDNVAVDVVEHGRLVEVSASGDERLGRPAPLAALAWCRRWWPRGRAEVGRDRDLAWAGAVAQVQRGLAVAMDYGHLLADRRPTLTGYRDGRQVRPVPDGSCDLTAHVALDACAAGSGARLTTQRAALRRLGVTGRPAGAGAAALQRASREAELIDPAGLGGFGWLVRPVGITDPLTLRP